MRRFGEAPDVRRLRGSFRFSRTSSFCSGCCWPLPLLPPLTHRVRTSACFSDRRLPPSDIACASAPRVAAMTPTCHDAPSSAAETSVVSTWSGTQRCDPSRVAPPVGRTRISELRRRRRSANTSADNGCHGSDDAARRSAPPSVHTSEAAWATSDRDASPSVAVNHCARSMRAVLICLGKYGLGSGGGEKASSVVSTGFTPHSIDGGTATKQWLAFLMSTLARGESLSAP